MNIYIQKMNVSIKFARNKGKGFLRKEVMLGGSII